MFKRVCGVINQIFSNVQRLGTSRNPNRRVRPRQVRETVAEVKEAVKKTGITRRFGGEVVPSFPKGSHLS